jgi:hypothetical protein
MISTGSLLDAAGHTRPGADAWISEQMGSISNNKNMRSGAPMAKRTRMMYIESKAEGLVGPARIGRVIYNKTGCTIRYGEKEFQSLKGRGFKSNYREINTGDEYWISGPRRDGADRLYVSNIPVEIDEDVREEYWTTIRKKSELKQRPITRA